MFVKIKYLVQGGSYCHDVGYCHVVFRNNYWPTGRNNRISFRIIKLVKHESSI